MSCEDLAEEISEMARAANRSIAVAESLTGGLLTAQLARSKGASEWFRGGIVAYNAAVKREVLNVPAGPVVSEQAATAMAIGVAKLMSADLAVSTTGVGGPGEEEDQPPGTVWISLSWNGQRAGSWSHRFDGDPSEVCRAACEAALTVLRDRLSPIEPPIPS